MSTILIEKNIMVPTRDGVKLATDIYRLEGALTSGIGKLYTFSKKSDWRK